MSNIEELKNLMKETEINNSFNIDVTSDLLTRVTEQSFSNLYNFQRSSIPVRQFFFVTYPYTSEYNTGDLYIDEKHRLCMKLDVDIVSQTARESYRHSDLYQQEFTIDDITNNELLFDRTILVRIDDTIRHDLLFSIRNGFLTIIFDRKDVFMYRDSIAHNIVVTIYPNGFRGTARVHRGILNPMMVEDDLYVDYQRYGLEKFRSDGTYFVSTKFDDETDPSVIFPCVLDDRGYLRLDVDESIRSRIVNNAVYVDLSLIFFTNLYEYHSKVYESIKPLQNPRYGNALTLPLITIVDDSDEYLPMPVAMENMMFFKQNKSEFIKEYKPEALNLHYPNMYEIIDMELEADQNFRIFYFYREADGLVCDYLFNFFYDFMKSQVDAFWMEEVINQLYYQSLSTSLSLDKRTTYYEFYNRLFTYIPLVHNYGIVDFIPKFSTTDPYVYKVNTMHEYIADNTNVLRKYVSLQNKLADSYYLFVETLDISHRLRLDTSKELYETIVFDEPMYLFIFNNTSTELLDMKIWVDGILEMKAHQYNEFNVDYIYIPVTSVTEKSYIEIELQHSFHFKTNLYLRNNTTPELITIINDSKIIPTLSDVLIYNEDESIQYPLEYVRIFTTVDGEDIPTFNEDGTFINHYTPISNIKILGVNDEVLGKTLIFKIDKISDYVQKNYTTIDFPMIPISELGFDISPDQTRIFYNGRLLTSAMYLIKDDLEKRVQFLFQVEPGDSLGIDITSYHSEPIYKTETIPLSGDIDLTDYIDKPFDIRFYDVYLNGRKLNEFNVFPVSDRTIKILNVHSTHVLEIYEKERDEEYYGFTKNVITYILRPEDILTLSFLTEEEKEGLRKHIIQEELDKSGKSKYIKMHDNDNTEPEKIIWKAEDTPYTRFKTFYYNELLPKKLLDPDNAQFIKEYITTNYPEIMETYNIHQIDIINNNDIPSSGIKDILFLDPDINAETATEVYMLGGYDDIL